MIFFASLVEAQKLRPKYQESTFFAEIL